MGLDLTAYHIPRSKYINRFRIEDAMFSKLRNDYTYADDYEIGYWRNRWLVIEAAKSSPFERTHYFFEVDNLLSLTDYLLCGDKSNDYHTFRWFDKFNTSDLVFVIKAWYWKARGHHIFLEASY